MEIKNKIVREGECWVCKERLLLHYNVFYTEPEWEALTLCLCDRYTRDQTDFLSQKGLLKEFDKFHRKKEIERYQDYSNFSKTLKIFKILRLFFSPAAARAIAREIK